MTHSRCLVLASGLISLGSVGCSPFSAECFYGVECTGAFGSGGASSSSGSSQSTSSSSSTTGIIPSCMGTDADLLNPATITNFVNNACGVFVRADAADASGDGTKERPFKSLQAAVVGAQGKNIFVCATSLFEEKLDISAPLAMYGGFDCTKEWSWDNAARSLVMGKSDEIPVTIEKSATNVTIWNVAIKAVDAMKNSGSSIAMAIDDVAVRLTRCDVSAGAGKKGLAGTSHAGSAAAGADAVQNVAAGCKLPFGAPPGKTTCNGTKTDGGDGGLGGDPNNDGGKGQSGETGSPASGAEGTGGVGDGQPGSIVCSAGVAGKSGNNGVLGNAGTAKDTLLSLSDVEGGSGDNGDPGVPGQGGGGGGGTRAGDFCGPAANMSGYGPGGGGGGAGGCGGVPGGGGQFGGSSIAILSLGIQLQVTDMVLITGAGGNGGAGGLAQLGGNPGKGAIGGSKVKVGFNNGCDGGKGGNGGAGGKGGGGRGGHSVGIAFKATPSAKLMPQFTAGAPGDGGDSGEKGIGGATAACWDFSTNTTCAQ